MNSLQSLADRLMERRSGTRFPMELRMRYRRKKGDKIHTPEGKTINISSSGVLFAAMELPLLGESVEVSLEWPVKVQEVCPIKLVAEGRVVRVSQRDAAVHFGRYEFRTQGRGQHSAFVDTDLPKVHIG